MKDHLLATTAPSALAATPPDPDLSKLPANVDRKTAAALVTRYLFPISVRTLERWPVPSVVVNGKAVSPTAAIFAYAQSVMDAAQARSSRSTARDA